MSSTTKGLRVSVRVDGAMKRRLRMVKKAVGLSDEADIVRMALNAGLPVLEAQAKTLKPA